MMGKTIVLGVLLMVAYLLFTNPVTAQRPPPLPIDAIYSFGASSADTGSYTATLGPLTRPYGDFIFDRPQRFTNGRVILDFLTEDQRFPYISAYVDSSETNFERGTNFASAGSTIQPLNVELFNHGRNHFTLPVQFYQFQRFKARSLQFHSQGNGNNSKISLPKPESFSRALYMFDHGQNDLHAGLETKTEEEVIATIPYMIGNYTLIFEKLYEEGARLFWVNNVGPMGCLPWFLVKYPPEPDNTDQIGCIQSYNEVTQEFNRQLSIGISEFQTKFIDTLFIPVDMYSLKYELISKATDNGFEKPLEICCGKLDEPVVNCGEDVIGNENLLCPDPSKYINWDGLHYTDAANKWMYDRIRTQVSIVEFPRVESVNYDK